MEMSDPESGNAKPWAKPNRGRNPTVGEIQWWAGVRGVSRACPRRSFLDALTCNTVLLASLYALPLPTSLISPFPSLPSPLLSPLLLPSPLRPAPAFPSLLSLPFPPLPSSPSSPATLFRCYPGPWQLLVRNPLDEEDVRTVWSSERMPTLKEVALEILPSVWK